MRRVSHNKNAARSSWFFVSVVSLTFLLMTLNMLLIVHLAPSSQNDGVTMSSVRRQLRALEVEVEVEPEEEEPSVTPSEQPKLRYDSSDATVLAMAQGYELPVHRRFVGSLRKSGFTGKIIYLVEPDLQEGVEDYLLQQNVTLHKLQFVPCDHPMLDESEIKNHHDQEAVTCIAPYPDVKIRWGRFPLWRDLLRDCETCTGPVLVSDVRDAYFQRDPLGDGVPAITGLQLFEEHRIMRTTNRFYDRPVSQCKGVHHDEAMLCSGTTLGTREAMLGYFDAMYQEMKQWMADPQCMNSMNGDDQAIHNYLYYTGQFDHLSPTTYAPRAGIVNTVGALGKQFVRWHKKDRERMGLKMTEVMNAPFNDANLQKGRWLPLYYDLTDAQGYFIDYDGGRSRLVHQYDRFDRNLERWVQKMDGVLYE